MKTIGLIGGMSWESSLVYYRIINQLIGKNLGNFHSAECILYSLDFEPIEKLQHEGNWIKLSENMIEIAKKLDAAGADVLALCTNTMHRCAPDIESNVDIPFIHIANATGDEIRKENISKVGLLGTKFTMEEAFYKNRLIDQYDLDVLIPENSDRQVIHDIIYSELVNGIIKEESKMKFLDVIHKLEEKGIDGIILGCTEIPMLIKSSDLNIKVFDTTYLHAKAIVSYSLK